MRDEFINKIVETTKNKIVKKMENGIKKLEQDNYKV